MSEIASDVGFAGRGDQRSALFSAAGLVLFCSIAISIDALSKSSRCLSDLYIVVCQ